MARRRQHILGAVTDPSRRRLFYRWVDVQDVTRGRSGTSIEQERLSQARRLAAECEYWLTDYLRRGLDKAS